MNSNKHTSASQAVRSRAVAGPRTLPEASPRLGRFGSSLKSTGSGALRGTPMSARVSRLVVFAFWASCTVAFALAGKSLIDDLLAMPYVHTSHSTGECVAVIAPDGSPLGCENKPERYHHVWVE